MRKLLLACLFLIAIFIGFHLGSFAGHADSTDSARPRIAAVFTSEEQMGTHGLWIITEDGNVWAGLRQPALGKHVFAAGAKYKGNLWDDMDLGAVNSSKSD